MQLNDNYVILGKDSVQFPFSFLQWQTCYIWNAVVSLQP